VSRRLFPQTPGRKVLLCLFSVVYCFSVSLETDRDRENSGTGSHLRQGEHKVHERQEERQSWLVMKARNDDGGDGDDDDDDVTAGPPTIVQGEMTQTVNVDEGFNVTINCDATGYPAPNISWVKVNGETLPPPYNRFAVKVSTFFSLRFTACNCNCNLQCIVIVPACG